MSLLSDVLSKKVTKIRVSQLSGVEKIAGSAFYNFTALSEVCLPSTLKEIESNSFYGCSALRKLSIDNISPYIKISSGAFGSIGGDGYIKPNIDIIASQPDETMICISNNRVLFHNKITDPTAGFVIPGTVINLTGGSCSKYGDISLTNVTIPDTVEVVGDDVFDGHNSLATITIGSSVRFIDAHLCPGTQTTTLIFRQPAGMYVELPTPGDGTGLAYNKNSHSITIYTDNECIKNYDWATDNVTVTFYSLSEAPV